MEIFFEAYFRDEVLFKLIIVSIAIILNSYHAPLFVDYLLEDQLIKIEDGLSFVVFRHVKDLVHLLNLVHGFAEDDNDITDGKLVHLSQQQGKINEVFIEGWITFNSFQVVFVCLILIALTFTCLTDHITNAPVCHRVLDDACGYRGDSLSGWFLG